MNTITIKRPDDWHLHLRDGDVLPDLVKHTARQFSRALIMPNLKPPVTTVSQALSYQDRIHQAAKEVGYPEFYAFMTLYLTDMTSPSEIVKAKENGIIGVKLYPELADCAVPQIVAVSFVTLFEYKLIPELIEENPSRLDFGVNASLLIIATRYDELLVALETYIETTAREILVVSTIDSTTGPVCNPALYVGPTNVQFDPVNKYN